MTKQRILELQKLQVEILCQLDNNCEEGYDLFMESWNKLDDDDKELIGLSLIKRLQNTVEFSNEIDFRKEIFIQAIIKHILSEPSNHESLKLTLSPEIKDVEIAKVFYELKRSGVITSSNKQIANAVAHLFSLHPQTIQYYFKNSGQRFPGVRALINNDN